MKFSFSVVVLFLSNCFGQSETKEAFVNEIYHTIVPMSSSSYILQTDAAAIPYDSLQMRYLQDELNKELPVEISRDFFKKIHDGGGDGKWNNALLKGARADVGFEAPLVSGSRCYKFSSPIFDNSGRYAAIFLSYSCGDQCGWGCIYLFRRENDKWQLLAHVDCWVS